jgi:hypothetical protein
VAGYANPWWTSFLVSRISTWGVWGVTTAFGLTDTAPDFSLGLLCRFCLD